MQQRDSVRLYHFIFKIRLKYNYSFQNVYKNADCEITITPKRVEPYVVAHKTHTQRTTGCLLKITNNQPIHFPTNIAQPIIQLM